MDVENTPVPYNETNEEECVDPFGIRQKGPGFHRLDVGSTVLDTLIISLEAYFIAPSSLTCELFLKAECQRASYSQARYQG